MNDQITTARLPMEISNKLHILAKVKGKTKSDIIKESIEMYYAQEENEIDSYTLGEPYFGKYASGESDLSTTYKERVKEKIAQKLTRENRSWTEGSGC
jgi:predicted DNA-binding protein